MSRFVLDSNNLWLVGNSDGTIRVVDGPYLPDLNTHNVPGDASNWEQMALIGANSTHQELEVFGVVFSTGQKLEELRKEISDNQLTINREGFMVQWLNPSGGDRPPKESNLYRRLNDLFDWSKYGVEIPTPIQTEWDRLQLNTGNLMVEGTDLAGLREIIEELEVDMQTLRDEKDMEIELLKKQAKDKEGLGVGVGGEKDKDTVEDLKKQLALKDKHIATLRDALRIFI